MAAAACIDRRAHTESQTTGRDHPRPAAGAVSYGTDLQIASHAAASPATGQTRCVIHFLRLLAVCWPSARDNHLLACNSAKYLPISKLFFHSQTAQKAFLNMVINNATAP